MYSAQQNTHAHVKLMITFTRVKKFSPLHSGGGTAGNVAEFPSAAAVHVVVESPINSKPELQV